MSRYTIRFPVNVNGWDEHLTINVEAENQWEACERVGEALSKLANEKRAERETNGG